MKKNKPFRGGVPQVVQPAPVQRPRGSSTQLRVEYSEHFSGPIPPPELLRKYDETLPGAADRILAMAERQSTHRQGIESMVIAGNVSAQKTGQWMGFAIALVSIGGGVLLLYNGRSIEGYTAMLAPLAGLVGIFVWTRKQQSQERAQKLGGKPPRGGGE